MNIRQGFAMVVLLLNALCSVALLFIADRLRQILVAAGVGDSIVTIVMVSCGVLVVFDFIVVFWILFTRPQVKKHEETPVPKPVKVEKHTVEADIGRHKEAFEREMVAPPPVRKIALPPIDVPLPPEPEKVPMPTHEELKSIKFTEDEEEQEEVVEEPQPEQADYSNPYYNGAIRMDWTITVRQTKSTAKCRVCKKNIPNGVLSVFVTSNDWHNNNLKMVAHADCFLEYVIGEVKKEQVRVLNEEMEKFSQIQKLLGKRRRR